jgi:pimeloyl-ACP methyl ester carboxylesterase
MTGALLSTGVRERAVFFPSDGNTLFGVLTGPEGPGNGVGVLLIQGGDTVNVSLHRNRLAVRLARNLAADGYTSLRFDYHGLGESSGDIGALHLHNPFTEDAEAAAGVMHDLGIDDLVLVGACFSARTALSAAPSIRGVRAVVMATPPVGGYGREDAMAERLSREWSWSDYVRRAARLETLTNLARPSHRQAYTRFARFKLRGAGRRTKGGDPTQRWVSPKLLAPLETMVERGIPVLVVYGDKDPLLGEWERAKAGRLGTILQSAGDLVEVVDDLPGVVHGFLGLDVQDRFLALAVDWIRAKVPTARQDRW